MIARGFAAILIGVVGAALIGAMIIAGTIVCMEGSARSVAAVLYGILFTAGVGIVLTAPAWILFCLILLPVVTHRVRIGRCVPKLTYLIAAFFLGTLLALPVFALLFGEVTVYTLLFSAVGGVGGLAVAQMWSVLVLNVFKLSNATGAARA